MNLEKAKKLLGSVYFSDDMSVDEIKSLLKEYIFEAEAHQETKRELAAVQKELERVKMRSGHLLMERDNKIIELKKELDHFKAVEKFIDDTQN